MIQNKFGRKFYKTEVPEYEQKVLDVSRVARVVAGGRRFSFRATLAAGNRAGKVGVGVAKGRDVSMAVEKAYRRALKSMVTVLLTKNNSLPHEVDGKFSSAYVRLKPARLGKGIVAGGAVRTILSLAGVRDASAKILSRSGNKLNISRATLEALKKMKPPRDRDLVQKKDSV